MNKFFYNQHSDLRAGWKILAIILLNTILSLILSFIIGVIPISYETARMVSMYGGEVVLIASVWIVLKLIDKKRFKNIGLNSFRLGAYDLVWGFLLGAVLMTLIFAVLLVTGEITLANALSNPNVSRFLWSGLVLFVFTGFAEELVFRGYIMTALQQMDRKWLTVLISAFIFALVHGGNPNASILGIINVFIVGILFAFMFIRTENLWMPIGFHIAWNYFQGYIFGFPVSGTEPNGIYNIESTGQAFLTGGSFGPEGGLLTTLFMGIGFLVVWCYPAKERQKMHIFSFKNKK